MNTITITTKTSDKFSSSLRFDVTRSPEFALLKLPIESPPVDRSEVNLDLRLDVRSSECALLKLPIASPTPDCTEINLDGGSESVSRRLRRIFFLMAL